MLHKSFENPELKIQSDGAGKIEGYASTFDNWDRVNEKPVKGAFTPYLADFIKNGFSAWSHQWGALPIGTIAEAYEDDHGLRFTAEFHSTAFAQETRTVAAERLARGKSVSTSIGYEVLDSEMVDAPELPGGKGTLLKLVPLFEISVVTVPANPLALISNAKDWLPAGLSMDDHSDAALAVVLGYVGRAKALQALRAKEGRTISAATAGRLRAVLDAVRGLGAVEKDIEALLELAEPPRAGDGEKAHLESDYLRLRQRLIPLYRS